MAVIRKRKVLKPKTDEINKEEKLTYKENIDGTKITEKIEEKIVEEEDEPETLKTKCWEYTKFSIKMIILITVAPVLINFGALLKEEKELKPEGFMIDVRNGQKLFKMCLGRGSPTVILDAPLGETTDVWSVIMPAIAKHSKVCAYDRGGLGFSDRPYKDFNSTKTPAKLYTAERMIEDMHKLFETEEKPFILVGADLGASVAKFYSQLFRDAVASVVLINPYYDGLFVGDDENPWNKYWYTSVLPTLQLKHIFAATGLTRIGIQTGLIKEPYMYENVPDVVKTRQKYLLCTPGHISSVVEESYYLNESIAQIRTLQKIRPFPNDIPVSLILSDQYHENISDARNAIWLKSQELSTQTYKKEVVKITKLKGSFPQLFFTSHKKIESVIINKIKQWKNERKASARY